MENGVSVIVFLALLAFTLFVFVLINMIRGIKAYRKNDIEKLRKCVKGILQRSAQQDANNASAEDLRRHFPLFVMLSIAIILAMLWALNLSLTMLN